MKRLLAAMVLAAMPSVALAAGSDIVWTTNDNVADNLRLVSGAWTSDDATGAVSEAYSGVANGFVCLVVTDPGATAPTDDYDITITDSDGVDIMGGTLANRDATATEQAVPQIGNAYGCRFVAGAFTVNITNAGNSKVGTVKVYVVR